MIENGEHGDTREVVGRVAERGKIDCRYSLDKLALEVGGNTDVQCKFFLVVQELAVNLGDLWGSGSSRLIGGGSRVEGRIEGNSVGLD